MTRTAEVAEKESARSAARQLRREVGESVTPLAAPHDKCNPWISDILDLIQFWVCWVVQVAMVSCVVCLGTVGQRSPALLQQFRG
eukprot:2418088-Amphidinium_carterae.1